MIQKGDYVYIDEYPGARNCYQGKILAVFKKHARVQLFSWMDGEPTEKISVPLEILNDPAWTAIYKDADTWHAAGADLL